MSLSGQHNIRFSMNISYEVTTRQTSQVKTNSNKKAITFQDFFEHFSLKFLCDAIFSMFPANQSRIPFFTKDNF